VTLYPCVGAVKGKWLELSTPKLALGCFDPNVKGLGMMTACVGLHGDTTV